MVARLSLLLLLSLALLPPLTDARGIFDYLARVGDALIPFDHRRVDTRGRLVCQTHDGSIVPVHGADVRLTAWATLPFPHPDTRITMKTNEDGRYWTVGGADFSVLSPFKFYTAIEINCAHGGIRNTCVHVEKQCRIYDNRCVYTKSMHTIDEKYYYDPKGDANLFTRHNAGDVDIGSSAWDDKVYCINPHPTFE